MIPEDVIKREKAWADKHGLIVEVEGNALVYKTLAEKVRETLGEG
jgi:hypothetical protein